MIRRIALVGCFVILSGATFAAQLDISIKPPVPQTVPQYGKVSAFYIVRNTTQTLLSGVHVRTLPFNVTQVTCDPNYCGASFDLGPAGSSTDSCVLKLTVKGPVRAAATDLLVCTSSECDVTSEPLSLTQGAALPFIAVAAGYYSNHHGGIFPLLASTHDSAATWSYPVEIFRDLQNAIDPRFENGVFSAAACNQSFHKNVCIAAGQWCAGSFCDNSLPLIAVGVQQSTAWMYPKSVFENLTTVIDPNLVGGSLRSGSCFGSGNNTVCIAGGTYFTANAFFPLLARSGNGGQIWTYPETIFKALTTAIDPDFKNGSLFTTACTRSTCDSVCVAAGNFCKTVGCDRQFPLLALSRDKGVTWTWADVLFKDLDVKLDPQFRDGYFVGSSCTGTGSEAICTAAGSFTTNRMTLPLLAVTRDGGATWTYPSELFKNLDVTIGHSFNGAVLNATACSGAGAKALCTAVGSYFRTSGVAIPVLSISRDGGRTWTWPDFIFTKLKTVVDPLFVNGTFDATTCMGTGKTGICMAAGSYCRNDMCFPLIAVSTNGGKSWFYPPSVYSNLMTTVDPQFRYGLFSDVSCKGNADHSLCIASGQYSNAANETLPLVAVSEDGGTTWTYPNSVHHNLTAVIDPDLAIGSLGRTAVSGGEIKIGGKRIQRKTPMIGAPLELPPHPF